MYSRLCCFSQSILKIPALVIVTPQQSLIWRVQGSPQRKLNFLLICTTILIIILLIGMAWQTCYRKFLHKNNFKVLWCLAQCPVGDCCSSRSRLFSHLTIVMTGRKQFIWPHVTSIYHCTLHDVLQIKLCKNALSECRCQALQWCAQPNTGELNHWGIQNHGTYRSDVLTRSSTICYWQFYAYRATQLHWGSRMPCVWCCSTWGTALKDLAQLKS